MNLIENPTPKKNLLVGRRTRFSSPRRLLGLAFVLSISLCHQGAFASALSQLAAGLQPGQFAELTGMTGFNNGNIMIATGGNCGASDYITEYANKAAWNAVAKQFQFVGSPHGNCGAIELVTYSEASNAWSIGPQPSSVVQAQHSYDHNTIDPASGTMYWRLYNSKIFYRLTSGGSSWSTIAAPNMSSVQCCGALEYFPDMARLMFIDGDWGIWSYDPSNNSWTHLARTNGNDGSGLPQYPMSGYTNFAEYSKLGFLVFGGGSNVYKMNASGAITTLASAPFGNVNIGTGSTCCSVAADPVTGNIIVIDGSGKLWELNPTGSGTWTVKNNVTTPSTFTAAGGTGESLISAPISSYGIIMYVKCNDAGTCNVYLYKHTASTSSPADQDFAQRCTAPGVIKCVTFDSSSDLAGVYGNPSGVIPGTSGNPQIDPTLKASGSGSVKFTIPSRSGSNAGGTYFTNFSNDLATQFGENSDFYIQWRQRFSPEMLTTTFLASGGGIASFKNAIIGTGDQPGCSPTGGPCYSSCSALEVTTTNTSNLGFPVMYNSCTGSSSHPPYDGFYQPFAGYDFKLQNGMPSPYCLYSQTHTNPLTYLAPNGNCFPYVANEWMTFQVHIHTGPRVNDEFSNSHVDLWAAREGQPSQQLLNWGPYNLTAAGAASNQRFGKVWLLPYMTNKDITQVHPTAYTWYDELIISTSKIPDPNSPPPSGQPPVAPTSLTVK